MNIYTSYYAKTKKLIQNNIIPISVSAFTPKYLKNTIKIYLKYLAPRYDMLKMSEENYIPKYKEILNSCIASKVIKDIESLTEGEDCALMCYEVPEDFCHRHLISEWLNKNTEYKIKEWSEIDTKQTVLF